MLQPIHQCVICLLLLCITSAKAQSPTQETKISPTVNIPKAYSPLYLGAFLGPNYTLNQRLNIPSTPKLKFEVGYNFGGTVGLYFREHLRGELQYTYTRTHHGWVGMMPATGRTATNALLANGFYDFSPMQCGLQDYVGLGIGVAHVDVYEVGISLKPQYKLAYQFIAGIRYNLDNMFYLDAQYRLLNTRQPENSFTQRYLNHMVSLGFVYNVPAA